jgi:hypothetical protein
MILLVVHKLGINMYPASRFSVHLYDYTQGQHTSAFCIINILNQLFMFTYFGVVVDILIYMCYE